MPSQGFFSHSQAKESKVLPPQILKGVLPESSETGSSVKLIKPELTLHQAQEKIYQFFIDRVRNYAPSLVLQEFKDLFVELIPPVNSDLIQALHTVILSNSETEFTHLFKRCCYILLNNWISQRQYQLSQELIQALTKVKNTESTFDNFLRKLKGWLVNFIKSKDYEEIQLFVSKYDPNQSHWTCRYTPFLLAPQYVDVSNSVEQREAARIFSQQLKEQFKFELAMYTSRSQSVAFKDRIYHNPTLLGDEALRLIKVILVNRGSFSYPSLAYLFINQSQGITYKSFKESLTRYLFYSVEKTALIKIIRKKVTTRLETLYLDNDPEQFSNPLLLRTCNYLIKYLTLENSGKPSSIFRVFFAQGNPLNLAILLLKLVLISPNSRAHLEVCLARLIHYYEDDKPEDCKWFINFLEIAQITLTIYGENVQYNLVNMSEEEMPEDLAVNLNNCRVFSQHKLSQKNKKDKPATPDPKIPPKP